MCLVVQLMLDASYLADERLDFFKEEIAPQLLGQRGQLQSAEPGQPLLCPQAGMSRRDHAGAA
jgi:hypothetical protein